MVNLRDDLIRASKSHFLAHIEKHRINVENLLNNAVGVGEHAEIRATIEKELAVIAEYDDKLEMLNKYFPIEYNGKDTKELLNG